jgi:metal-responsive CopG/Arc/MetJ family transcriptional regulator
MSTINISLPQKQASFVDSLVTKYGFANRSELVRSLIRLITNKPEILSDAATFPFIPTPPDQSVKEVIADMRKTKKYSSAFLKEVAEGLKHSDYFTK